MRDNLFTGQVSPTEPEDVADVGVVWRERPRILTGSNEGDSKSIHASPPRITGGLFGCDFSSGNGSPRRYRLWRKSGR
jgi:hypothetical protein